MCISIYVCVRLGINVCVCVSTYVLIEHWRRQFNAALNFYWQFHALFCNNFRGIVHDDASLAMAAIMAATSVHKKQQKRQKKRQKKQEKKQKCARFCLCVKYY